MNRSPKTRAQHRAPKGHPQDQGQGVPAVRRVDSEWKAFERSTKRALEALGYTVDEDRLKCGSQIDLVAHKPDKLLPHQLLVECKSSGKPVGIEEVRSFASLVAAVPRSDVATFGLIVAMTGFTKEAREFAKASGVRLTTLQELGLKAFDPALVVDKAISWYENDALAKGYVDLTCTVHEFGTGTVYKPVEKFFDEYFASTKRHGVAVLGNFGSGKTSLCRHYAYLLAVRWRDHQDNALLPIYVNLRDLSGLYDIEKELQRLLRSEYGQDCSISELHAWLEVGRTLLILDGFDEMGARLSNADVRRSLEALARFADTSRVKIILTCRTHFFRSRIDEDSLKNSVRLYIRDWGTEELLSYVNRAHGVAAERTIATIKETYNLQELARTPMFLKMITNTVSEFGDQVNRGKLYQLYTDQWIDSQNDRSNLTPQEVRTFMEVLAEKLYVSGTSTIDHKDLPNEIQEALRLRDRESIAQFDQDVRTCTFLVRDAGGRYGYIHRSFMEFFLGLKLAEELKARNTETFSRIDISVEVSGFMSCFFESEPEVLARMLMSDVTETARANCARALSTLRLTPRIEDALLLALDMDPADLVKQRVVEALSTSKSERGIDRILQLAATDSHLGLICLEGLAPFNHRPGVKELFAKVLRGNSSYERIRAVVEAVSAQRITEMKGAILAFLKRSDWALHLPLAPSLLVAVHAIWDVELALASLELIDLVGKDRHFAPTARQITADLTNGCRSEVDSMARAGREKGLSHGSNFAALRRRFGILLQDEFAKSALNELYGGLVPVKGRKASRVKGG